MSGYDTQVPFHLQNVQKQSFQSDAEFFGDVRPITSNLPNAAPAPFVYLGFCCAVLAGLCFTSRFLSNLTFNLPLYFASFSNVMVKYVPEVSSWQLLFVRCSMQVKYSIGNR